MVLPFKWNLFSNVFIQFVSYGVTIQMKPLQQYFHMVLFIKDVVLTLSL